MASTLSTRRRSLHLVLFQTPRPQMAKVDLNLLQRQTDAKRRMGARLEKIPGLLGLTDAEFAARIGVTPQQLSNWYAGRENAAIWRYLEGGDTDVANAYIEACVKGRPGWAARTIFERVG